MKYKRNFKLPYLFLFLLILIPKVSAQDILETIGDSLNADPQTLILMVGLFFLIFAILQKAANMVFGNKTTINLISALLSLVSIIFMPQELLEFFVPYELLVVSIAVIIFPITLLDLLGMKSRRLKHFFLIIIYILALVGFSYLFSISEFEMIFELEFPMFFLGGIILKNLIRWVLWIAIIYSIFTWIKETKIHSHETGMMRLEELRQKATISKDDVERKKFELESRVLRQNLKKGYPGKSTIRVLRLLSKIKKSKKEKEKQKQERIKNIPIYR